MSADFLLAACPAPLAQYRYTPSATSATADDIAYTELAPEYAWIDQFRRWLAKPETIDTILQTVDIYTIGSYDGWGDFVRNSVYYSELEDDVIDGLDAYCDTLNANLTITNNTAEDRIYAPIVTQQISEYFIDAAHNAFVSNAAEGAVHNNQFITAGLSWGDVPTAIFDDVSLLSWIDFFKDYPIAVIAGDEIIDWVNHEGTSVSAPE